MSAESLKIMAQRQHTMQKNSIGRSVYRWLQMKRYQFEVTIPIYMLTPAEGLVFYLVVSLFTVLFFTMAYLYLPNHIFMIQSRVWYYVKGSGVSSTIAEAVRTTKTAMSDPMVQNVVATTTQHVVKEL